MQGPANNTTDERNVAKQPTANVTVSGLSEFDYLGKDDSDLARDDDDENEVKEDGANPNGTRKSLEKDFEIAAEEDATEAESPVRVPTASVLRPEETYDDLDDTAINNDRTSQSAFKINPVATYHQRSHNHQQQRQ